VKNTGRRISIKDKPRRDIAKRYCQMWGVGRPAYLIGDHVYAFPGPRETQHRTDKVLAERSMHPGNSQHDMMCAGGGDGHLSRVRLRDGKGTVTERPVRHLFLMAGAVPATGWLDGCVALDARGFVKTGADLTHDDLQGAGWPLGRAPFLLETSRPGVLAVGDVRSGSVKRVASAVGEGSVAISFVHRILHG